MPPRKSFFVPLRISPVFVCVFLWMLAGTTWYGIDTNNTVYLVVCVIFWLYTVQNSKMYLLIVYHLRNCVLCK